VAIIVPTKEYLIEFSIEQNIGGDFEELCRNKVNLFFKISFQF
jgi:hypothetical protein